MYVDPFSPPSLPPPPPMGLVILPPGLLEVRRIKYVISLFLLQATLAFARSLREKKKKKRSTDFALTAFRAPVKSPREKKTTKNITAPTIRRVTPSRYDRLPRSMTSPRTPSFLPSGPVCLPVLRVFPAPSCLWDIVTQSYPGPLPDASFSPPPPRHPLWFFALARPPLPPPSFTPTACQSSVCLRPLYHHLPPTPSLHPFYLSLVFFRVPVSCSLSFPLFLFFFPPFPFAFVPTPLPHPTHIFGCAPSEVFLSRHATTSFLFVYLPPPPTYFHACLRLLSTVVTLDSKALGKKCQQQHTARLTEPQRAPPPPTLLLPHTPHPTPAFFLPAIASLGLIPWDPPPFLPFITMTMVSPPHPPTHPSDRAFKRKPYPIPASSGVNHFTPPPFLPSFLPPPPLQSSLFFKKICTHFARPSHA